jgi:hypothetical protein
MQILVRKKDNVVVNVASDGFLLTFDRNENILYRGIKLLPASMVMNNYYYDGKRFTKIIKHNN